MQVPWGCWGISHQNAVAERPVHSSSMWGDTHPSESLRVQISGAKPPHLWTRKAKHGYGKEKQMITIVGVKIPWERRQKKQREGMKIWRRGGFCSGDVEGYSVGSRGSAPVLHDPAPSWSLLNHPYPAAHLVSTEETSLASRTQCNPTCSHLTLPTILLPFLAIPQLVSD